MGPRTPTGSRAGSAFLQSWLEITLVNPLHQFPTFAASTAPIPRRIEIDFPQRASCHHCFRPGTYFAVLISGRKTARAGHECFDRLNHRHGMDLSHTDRATHWTVTFNAKLGSPSSDYGRPMTVEREYVPAPDAKAWACHDQGRI